MKARDLHTLGIPYGPAIGVGLETYRRAIATGMKGRTVRATIARVAADPVGHLDDALFGGLARALCVTPAPFTERESPAPWKQWGVDLDDQAVNQMINACRLPVSVQGALMPDAHVGYGLPIGGVIATENAVIPYAVGVDIACRMMMTVVDVPVKALKGEKERLARILERETRFGIGAAFKHPHDHSVMDADWSVSPITRQTQAKARVQLGTSGSGNHFVEYGTLTLDEPDLGLGPGTYVAILSHSGSRGPGSRVASHYSRLAMNEHPELPKDLKHLAWLDLDSEAGQEYWAAMELMGAFASANHHVIHRELVRALKTNVLAQIENHHNYAWREVHQGRDLVVHRKGATPATRDVLGIIPGSMATPAFVVRGKGDPDSLTSAAHGAGRVMSRTQARSRFTWSDTKKLLADRGVTLLSAGLDEVPGVYKDILSVMDQQRDLVTVVARFDPKIVKMAPPGDRPED